MKITADMRKITPSGYGEEAYQAARPARRYADVVGPAGVLIPDQRTAWRVTSDPKLLTQIARAAFDAHRASIITPDRETALVDMLAAALAESFPPADMEVLRRHELASVRGRTSVDVGRYGLKVFFFPDPMLLPNGKGSFHTGQGSGLPVPEAALPYFDDLAAIEDVKGAGFMNAQHWPGQLKVREGRWPFWREIEAEWPMIGAWMARERTGAGQSLGDRK